MTVVLISGCSHHNFIESGQSYFAKQRFELAVAQFEQALIEKPDHQPTIEQLQRAKNELNRWAVQLEIKADHANNVGQPGKAIVLYSKVAQLTRSSHSIEQYKKLYKKLHTASSLHAKLLPNNIGVTQDDVANINGLRLVEDEQTAMLLSFKKSNPIFEIQQSSLTKKTQYISGSQMIANPEFSQIQHRIRHHQDNRHKLRAQLTETRHHLNQHNKQLNKLKSQQQSVSKRSQQTDLAASALQRLQKQQKKITKKIAKAEQNIESTQSHVDKYRHQLSHNSNQLSELIDRLAYTSAVVATPLYSDYHYQVQRQHNSLGGKLYLTLDDSSTRVAQVSVSSQDESHPAQPTIALGADPMIVKNQQQLAVLFDIEMKQIARRLLTELVDEKRHQLLALARKTTDIDNKFSLWVNYAMVTNDGALPQIAQKIQQILIMEYGVGGEFDVNQLLHRYQ